MTHTRRRRRYASKIRPLLGTDQVGVVAYPFETVSMTIGNQGWRYPTAAGVEEEVIMAIEQSPNDAENGEELLRQLQDEDTVEYDLHERTRHERTRHELVRGTKTSIGTLIKVGFWIGIGFSLAGIGLWLVVLALVWLLIWPSVK